MLPGEPCSAPGAVTGQDGSRGSGHVHRKPRPGPMLRYSGDRRLCGCRTPRQAWRIWPRALLWGHGPTAVEWSVSFQTNGIEPFFFLNHSKSPREEEEMSGAPFRQLSEDSGSRVSGAALGILHQARHGFPGGILLQYW